MNITNAVSARLSNINVAGLIDSAKANAKSAGASLVDLAVRAKNAGIRGISFAVAFVAAGLSAVKTNLVDAVNHVRNLPLKGKVAAVAVLAATSLGTLWAANKLAENGSCKTACAAKEADLKTGTDKKEAASSSLRVDAPAGSTVTVGARRTLDLPVEKTTVV